MFRWRAARLRMDEAASLSDEGPKNVQPQDRAIPARLKDEGLGLPVRTKR